MLKLKFLLFWFGNVEGTVPLLAVLNDSRRSKRDEIYIHMKLFHAQHPPYMTTVKPLLQGSFIPSLVKIGSKHFEKVSKIKVTYAR